MFYFWKMQATGNDFIVVDYIDEKFEYSFKLLSKFMCDRHYGVGADGLIIVEKSDFADFKMRIFNSDGSEAEMCGNGIRCFAKYIYEKKLIQKEKLKIETLAGIKEVEIFVEGKTVMSVKVDMGMPIFEFEKIPVICENYIERESINNDITYANFNREFVNKQKVKGIKIAFLAYTYGITSNPKNLQEAPYSLNLIQKEKMAADIKKSKDQGADFTFVLMHWGDVESSVQNNEQKELADFLFQNGADFIFGTHPASIQPMEVRENSQGKNIFIAYSTGNLISSREYENSNIEMILNIEITKDAETGETRLSKVTYTPVYLLDRGKNAEDRYKLLDVKTEIENYENRSQKNISQEEYEKCLQALIDIDKLIGKTQE